MELTYIQGMLMEGRLYPWHVGRVILAVQNGYATNLIFLPAACEKTDARQGGELSEAECISLFTRITVCA